MTTPLFFKDGTQFATDFVRIEHGGRGDYVELTKEQICVDLVSKFGRKPVEVTGKETFYYYWLVPVDRWEKVYLQLKGVGDELKNYAVYHPGMYYISPKALQPFIEK